MTMRSIRRWVLAAGLVLGWGPAGLALGLGPIHSKTAINQYFYATIPVESRSASTFRSLKVRLAGYRQFKKRGLDYPPVLMSFRFRLKKMANGQHDIVVTSDQPIRRPFLVFLLDVRWPSGQLMREYTVLLNPPLLASSRPVPRIREVPLPQSHSSRRPVQEPSPVSSAHRPLRPSTRTLGPVRVGQTLWAIAHRRVSNPARIDQMMLAIYRRNPYAFFGNINRLRAGAVLRIPPAHEIRTIPLREAIAFVRTQDRVWRSGAAPGRAISGSSRLVLLSPSRIRVSSGLGSAPAVVARLRKKLKGENARVTALAAAVKNQKAQITRLKNLLTLKSQALISLEHAAPHKVASRPLLGLPSLLWVLLSVLVILVLGWFWIKRRSGRQERGEAVGLTRPTERVSTGIERNEPIESMETPSHETAAPGAPDLQPAETGSPDEASFDPFTEVKFHMAYGLYDRAIETLTSWLDQNPERQDVQLKLLEVYATAGRSEEYVALARRYQSRFGTGDAHWPEVAERGRQMAPSDPLFDKAAPHVPKAMAAPVETEPTATSTDNIEHYFDELMGTPEIPAGPGTTELPPLGSSPSLIHRESDIGTDTTTNTEINLEFELESFTPDAPRRNAAERPSAADPTGTQTGSGTLNPEAQKSFDESIAAITQHTATLTVSGLGTGTETVATKIDLARAYLEMGDKDSAKSILDEVLEEGSSAQKTQAREILTTISTG